MGDHLSKPRNVLSEAQVSRVTRTTSAFLTYLSHDRRLEEARESYLKVLELDARHSIALGFLGMVYHLTNNTDKAIVKYHEVRASLMSYACSHSLLRL